MKSNEKKALVLVGAIGLWALMMRKASAATQPPQQQQPRRTGDVLLGPVTVQDLGPASEQEQLLWPRLQLAIDQAKASTHYDEDVGAQKNPGPAGLAHIDGSIALWRQLYPSSADNAPSVLEQMRAQAPNRPTDDRLARATHLVRTLTGWNEDTADVTRAPSPAEISRMRDAIKLWQGYSELSAEYLQLLLDDAMALSPRA